MENNDIIIILEIKKINFMAIGVISLNFRNNEQDKIDLLFNNNNNNNNKNNIYMDINKIFLFILFNNNYNLIELNSDNIIFSLQSLYNVNSMNSEGGSIHQLKINKKRINIGWNFISLPQIKNNYMIKYSSYFNEENNPILESNRFSNENILYLDYKSLYGFNEENKSNNEKSNSSDKLHRNTKK